MDDKIAINGINCTDVIKNSDSTENFIQKLCEKISSVSKKAPTINITINRNIDNSINIDKKINNEGTMWNYAGTREEEDEKMMRNIRDLDKY